MATPQATRDQSKRERILRAALEICAAKGVVAARMDEVAARARVSKGTLYRFFRSKEDLFLATMLAAYEDGLRLVDAELARIEDPRRRLQAYLDGLVEVLASVGPRMDLHYQAWGVVAGAPAFQSRLYDFLRDFHRARDAEIEAMIRAGQEAGLFRSELDPGALTRGISALLGGLLYRATFDAPGARPEDLRACFDVMVLDALVRSDAPEA